ncbi:MAG: glycosyl hydrolase [Bacteroidota bacterium]
MKVLKTILFLALLSPLMAVGAKIDTLKPEILSGLTFRSIGPAFCSGRIVDFAVNPKNPFEYYVAAAAGHVWKTSNAGTTWKPVFDKQGSYSIGPVVIDPGNTNIVWIGSGEFNSQRSVGYGDGIYKSEDGGQNWKNMGLKQSEHIGRILVDPRNSDVVYVAAQGPLWGPGGDRGLYKTTDGGKTWKAILSISENTGCNDIICDPRNPDVLYATSYQRRRHVYTLINGGPESAVYKSIDAGLSWNKINVGLPDGDMGRIGIAISPVNPDMLYAVVEAKEDKGGFFRSSDRGASWEKRGDLTTTSAQYYNRIFCDPKDENRVFSMDTYTKYTLDGGKTWKNLGNKHRHVDDHAFWIDPNDTRHLLIGGDGGVYETFDMDNWDFKANLPVTQFYKVATDNDLPFYNVYGGTQDNSSMGGPSRTTSSAGIVNDDWWVTHGGDGFETQVDPTDPNVVYAQAQYGDLARYDRKSGEEISIQPQPPAGEAYRWNWDSPLLISPHQHNRLYFAANKLFRSDDGGNYWQVISPDLTRQLDRNTLPVMGKIQRPEAVAKNASTSFFGNIVALSESPKQENLIYVGTDDGLIQITEDAGKNWRKVEKFTGVPEMTYVTYLFASNHDPNVVYASFDNHKNADFKPYLMKSTDKGDSWKSISANLPIRGSVNCIVEDPINPDLLFVGTEFGLFVSVNAGDTWTALKNGLPTIAVKDMEIQKRENDLVIATFGRGFYILDDYSALRKITKDVLDKEAQLFPVKDAYLFVQRGEKYGQGESYYGAKNPPVGVNFTYFLKDEIISAKSERQKMEKDAEKKGDKIDYPSMDQLKKEDLEEKAFLMFTITDAQGQVVRKLTAPASKGLQRLTWDFRYPSVFPASVSASVTENSGSGLLSMPGTYKVSMAKSVNGVITEFPGEESFATKILYDHQLTPTNRQQNAVFQEKVSDLARVVSGSSRELSAMKEKVKVMREAFHMTAEKTIAYDSKVKAILDRLDSLSNLMEGDPSLSKRNENQPPSITDRVNNVIYGIYNTTTTPTQTMQQDYVIAANAFGPVLASLKKFQDIDIKELETALEKLGAPYTPGRLPEWKMK